MNFVILTLRTICDIQQRGEELNNDKKKKGSEIHTWLVSILVFSLSFLYNMVLNVHI